MKSWEEELYWKHFHFSQFSLTLPTDFNHHLTLPKKFCDYMRTTLPEQIVLKVNGISWDVNLKKDLDDIMFHGDGWKEFADAYSLKKADVLVFKYNRRECFEVWLFDQASSCEKEASYFVRKVQQENSDDDDEEEDHHDDSEDTEESLSKGFTDDTRQDDNDNCHYGSRNRRRKNPGSRVPKSSSAKTARSRDVSDDEDESDENSDEEDSFSEEARTTPKKAATTSSARKLRTNGSRKRNRNGGSRDVSDDQDESDENSDEEDSTSEETRTTQKKAATTDSPRKLPINGSRKRNRNGGSCAKKISGNESGSRHYTVCYKSNRREITDAEIENAERKAVLASEQCANSFTAVMRPTSVYWRFFMTISADWNLKKHFRSGQAVSLRVEGKIWECKISKDSRNHAGFQCSGWRNFARDNFLEEFDVCLFVPSVSMNERYVLDVSIFRVVPEVVPPTLVTSP